MKKIEQEYKVLPYYFTHDLYTPRYTFLFYRTTKDYLVHALKVRSDIILPKIWNQAVADALPPDLLDTLGTNIHAYLANNIGEPEREPIGYLGIYDGKVVGIKEIDPRKLIPPNDKYRTANYLHDWENQYHPRYTLIDYTPEELFEGLKEGMKQYAGYWKESETIWEDLGKKGETCTCELGEKGTSEDTKKSSEP